MAVAYLLALLAAVFLYTRENDAPFFSHADEPSKVYQVQTKQRNLRHPPLLLDVTTAASKHLREYRKLRLSMQGVEDDDPAHEEAKKQLAAQPMAELGRTVAAWLMALGIIMLALATHVWMGWKGGLLVLIVLIINPFAFYFSHFFKEEPALIFGLGGLFLGTACFSRWPASWMTLLLFGLGLALGLSGKYIGVVFLVPCLIANTVILFRSAGVRRRAVRLLMVLAVFLVSWAVINQEVLAGLEVFRSSLEREVRLVQGEQLDSMLPSGLPYYWSRLISEPPVAGRILCGVFLIAGLALWRKRPETRVLWLVPVSMLLYVLVIGMSSKVSPRYLLPVHVLLPLTAVFGAVLLMELAKGRPFWRVTANLASAALIAGIVAEQVLATRPLLAGFRKGDVFTQFQDWAKLQLPPEAVVAQKVWRYLPDEEEHHYQRHEMTGTVPFQVETFRELEDFGSIQPLVDQGISHVLVSLNDSYRYQVLRDDPRILQDPESDIARRVNFYREVDELGATVWEALPGVVQEIQPHLKLVKLPSTSAAVPEDGETGNHDPGRAL